MSQFIAILFEAIREGFKPRSDFRGFRGASRKAMLHIRRRLLRNIMLHQYECQPKRQKNA